MAQRLAKHTIRLGVPVVALTTLIGTSVSATLEENVARHGMSKAAEPSPAEPPTPA